jgi:polyhydroxybutyrate depolymerase
MEKIIIGLIIFLMAIVGVFLFMMVYENPPQERNENEGIDRKKAKEGLMKIKYNGEKRRFAVDIPSDYDPAKDYPLLFGFHGSGANYKSLYLLFRKIVEKEKVIGVYPESAEYSWRFQALDNIKNEESDVGFTSFLMEYMKNNYSVDKERIYATGKSAGGYLCHRLGMELSEQIAAIAPMSSSLEVNTEANKEFPLSVLQVHGEEDKKVPYEGGSVRTKTRRITFKSAENSVLSWAKALNCNLNPETKVKEGYSEVVYTGCEEGTEVRLINIPETGHFVPIKIGNTSKVKLVWDFLQDKRKD